MKPAIVEVCFDCGKEVTIPPPSIRYGSTLISNVTCPHCGYLSIYALPASSSEQVQV